jgi:dipeptidyl aminopeptidase/acylaminoacyl peptidase
MASFRFLLLAAVLVLAVTSFGQSGKPGQLRRPAIVTDAIEMRRLGDPSYFNNSPDFNVANFSPDGKRFIVILTKGDLKHNTNQYSILLFRTSRVFSALKPEVLLTMSSSSNREAIRNLKWLTDNETVAFIGENPGESPQAYTLNIRTKVLERMTEHPTPIVAFETSENGEEFIFEADPPTKRMTDSREVRRNGIVVTTQLLSQLLAGDCYSFVPTLREGEEVFVKARGKPSIRIPLDDVAGRITQLSVSPNGRYALIEAFVRHVPRGWQDYEDKFVHEYASEQQEGGNASLVRRYELLEVQSGRVTPLLDAPSGYNANAFAWAPDGRSVVVSGAFLPLDVPDPAERDRRKKNTYVVEIKLPSKSVVPISDKALRVMKWDRNSNRVFLVPSEESDLPSTVFEKTGSEWKEVPVPLPDRTEPNSQLKLTLEEDSNTPPKIYATGLETQRKMLLLDLNPQFGQLLFGKVEEISWNATDGHRVVGGLYLPPAYTAGTRYPLVIQTHGFSKNRFLIDGPWSSAFAAQPLAGKGIVVLQLQGPDPRLGRIANTPQEALYQMAEYEGAIDYLDARGLIDRSRVGIIGFSRTVYIVEYALTHSKYRFAAATVADGINGGYFSYVVNPTGSDERLNGGPPFGDTLALWLKNSPGFNLDKVHTPVRLEYYGSSATVLGGWEWFSILSRLRRPVDLIYLPHASHQLVKPWERLTSQQGNVDWFTFWLKGEEDHDPAKREQYARWHHFRDIKGQATANAAAEEELN